VLQAYPRLVQPTPGSSRILAARARGCFSPASLDDASTGRRARLLPGGGTDEGEREAIELREVLRPLLRDLTARDRRLLRLLTRLIARLRAQIADDRHATGHVAGHVSPRREVVVLARQAP
jgi:hypothetical protein